MDMANASIIRLTLLASLLLFFFHQNKNLKAPHILGVFAFTMAIVMSVLMTGWINGAYISGETFITQALIPFLLFSTLTDTVRKLYIVFAILILASVIMIHNGYTQILDENGVGWAGNVAFNAMVARRINYLGYFNDPNDLGMYFVMVLPIVFYLKNEMSSGLRWMAWLMILALLYGIYLTGSRGTLLALIGLVGLWFWRTYGTWKSILLGLAGSPVLLVVLSKFRSIGTDDESAFGRLEAWYQGYQMFFSSPVFGVGHNQFTELHFRTAHNSYVLVLAELGIVGAFIWALLLITTMRVLWCISKMKFVPEGHEMSLQQQLQSEREARISHALFYSFVAYFIAAFFISRSYVPVLYLFIGLAAANYIRVCKIFPKHRIEIYDMKELSKWSMQCLCAFTIGTYLILKVTL